jgi:methionine-rich copper-binding protein CopC
MSLMSWARRIAVLAAVPLWGCTSQAMSGSTVADHGLSASLLERSIPAAGARVRGPVQQIELWFRLPVRLVELTVTGADGLVMPTMLTSVSQVRRYSVPISGLEQGTHTINWRATADGVTHQGAFQFVMTRTAG